MFCELCKVAIVLASVLLTIADGRPGILDSHGLSPGSYSGGGGNSYGGASYATAGEGLGSYGSDQNGLESHHSESSDGGDYHHGVSVVSLGGLKGQTFDLTKHGGGGHDGVYGGSFVVGKYESGGEEGHQGGEGGYGNHYTSVSGYDEHSSLLAAGGHSGFDGTHSY